MDVFNKRKIELVVIRNAINTTADDISILEGNDIVTLMQTAFKSNRLPAGLQIFHEDLTPEANVTPKNEADVKTLLKLRGRIYVVVLPQGLDPVSWLIIGASIIISVVAALFFTMPKIPDAGASNTPPSPNNALAQRTNRQRMGGRVPDIVGEVWATPDLVAPPYSIYIDDIETEYSLMCLGRGEYEVQKVLDDTSDVSGVTGTNVSIFKPGNDIRNTPDISIGNSLNAKELAYYGLAMRRYTSINGQVLPRPDNYYRGDSNITFSASTMSGSSINIRGQSYTFVGQFSQGETITIAGATKLISDDIVYKTIPNPDPDTVDLYPTIEVPWDYASFDGEYAIRSITENSIYLEKPYTNNASWRELFDNGDTTIGSSAVLTSESKSLWTDWQYTSDEDAEGLIVNLLASSGIYRTHNKDGKKYLPYGVLFEIQAENITADNVPVPGTAMTQISIITGKGAKAVRPIQGKALNGLVVGVDGTFDRIVTQMTRTYQWTNQETARETAAKTIKVAISGLSRFRIRRVSTEAYHGDGEVLVDEVKVKDLFSYRTLAGLAQTLNRESTLIAVKTRATEGALSVKDRKLKALVTRKINTPSSELVASKRVEDIIYHLATDPKIGGLADRRLDMVQIRAEMDVQRLYFGVDKLSEFGYTFDDANISSEESLQVVAQAAYSQLYRYNNLVHMHFERPQPVAVAIFNSHNILPGSYQHSESFGISKGFDGVVAKYVDPKDGAELTVQFPVGVPLSNPEEIKLIGVRDKLQALVHAARKWNKHVFSYKTVEFVGADESNIIVPSQRVDVADQYRAGVMQGSVLKLYTHHIHGLVMQLSDPIDDATGGATHTLFVQLMNGQVDYMPVVKVDMYNVQLPRVPSYTVSSDINSVVQATYALVENVNVERDSYVVSSKDIADGANNKVTAVNYDSRYYKDDLITVGDPV